MLFYQQLLQIIGSRAAIVDEIQREDNVVFRNEDGDHVTPAQYSFQDRYKESYAAELRHFINLINGTEAPTVLEEEVVRAMIIVEAIERAYKSNSIVDVSY